MILRYDKQILFWLTAFPKQQQPKSPTKEKKKIVMEWRDRLLMEKMATEALLMHFLSTSRGSSLASLYFARKMGTRGHDLLKRAQRYLEMQFMSQNWVLFNSNKLESQHLA